jgi:hypothetical protein
LDHAEFKRAGGFEWRQDTSQAPRHRVACARRANRQQIVAARSGDPATLLGHRPIAAGFDKYTETDLSLDPQCSTFVSLVVEPNTDIFRLARSEFTMCIPEIVIATIQMSHVPVTTYWHEL